MTAAVSHRLRCAGLARAAIVGGSMLTITACAQAATTGRSTTPSAPANDSFNGGIVAGSGRYAGARAPLSVYIYPGSSRAESSSATFTIVGRHCKQRHRCLVLNGTLRGTLTRSGKANPDAGSAYAITAHGHLAPLGKIKASGSVAGPGNVRQGREEIELTTMNRHGTVTIHAFSRLVPSFSSP